MDIPIQAAKDIADIYDYDQVIIIARKVGRNEHVTTYGKDQANCTVAAEIGRLVKYNMMRWEPVVQKEATVAFAKGDRVMWRGVVRHGYSNAGHTYLGTGVITELFSSCTGGKRIPIRCARVKIDNNCEYPYFSVRTNTTISLGKLAKVE